MNGKGREGVRDRTRKTKESKRSYLSPPETPALGMTTEERETGKREAKKRRRKQKQTEKEKNVRSKVKKEKNVRSKVKRKSKGWMKRKGR